MTLILVVEDDFDSREHLAALLRSGGYEVATAANGLEAQQWLVSTTALPSVILLDLVMPVMDGWELIRRLKANPDTVAIPIIALTAHAMIGDREQAMAAGCHNYITKPLSVKSFISDLVGVLTDIPDLHFSAK